MRELYKNIVLSILALSFILFFVFTAKKYIDSNSDFIWNKLNISVVDSAKYDFVTSADIRRVVNVFDYQIGKTHIDSIDTYLVRKKILENRYVKHLIVYLGFDGSLNIIIKQFNPVLLINSSTELYMVSDSAEQRIVNGVIKRDIPYITMDNKTIELAHFYKNSINKDIPLKDIIKIICKFADNLKEDELLSELIVQININNLGEVELIPRFGSNIIVLCDLSDLNRSQEYLDKLKLFYKTMLQQNKLDLYSTVNMKFKNQVSAKKRKNEEL